MKCLGPVCTQEATFRGLCKYCYSSASQLVRSGILTWEGLIEKNLALEVKPRGRPKQLTNDELRLALAAKSGQAGPRSREEYIEAVGGDLRVVSKKHRAMLDSIFPPAPIGAESVS